jgi:integrase
MAIFLGKINPKTYPENTMATLPRGIALVQWTNKDGSTTTKYKVRITRKDFKCNQNFDNLSEAKEFLALSKIKKGKELIWTVTEEERKQRLKKQRVIDDNNYSFGYFADLYIENYIETKPQETELQRRNVGNTLSFYKTIRNTSIPNRHLTYEQKDELNLEIDTPVYFFFGGFDIRNIKSMEINYYIKERLKHVKPSSVSREITHISNVFSKLQYFNESLADLPNPTRTFDKELLKNRHPKREFSIRAEEEEKLFKLLSQKQNKQMFHIAKLSLMTALRRSEVITLNRSQVKDNYIQLIYTKSGRSRKVYIDKAAQDYINTIPNFTKTDRFFTYTISGFDRVFRSFMKKNKLLHIHFHDLRRLSISKKIMEIGFGNSILLSEILGIQSVPKFEQLHQNNLPLPPTTQQTALFNFGHSHSQTTKGYLNLIKIEFNNGKK